MFGKILESYSWIWERLWCLILFYYHIWSLMKSPLGIEYMFGIVKKHFTDHCEIANLRKIQSISTKLPQCANVPSSPKPLSINGTFSNPAISGGLFLTFEWGGCWTAVNLRFFLFLLMKRNEYGTTGQIFLCQLVWFVWSDYFFGVVSRYFLYILFFLVLCWVNKFE